MIKLRWWVHEKRGISRVVYKPVCVRRCVVFVLSWEVGVGMSKVAVAVVDTILRKRQLCLWGDVLLTVAPSFAVEMGHSLTPTNSMQ